MNTMEAIAARKSVRAYGPQPIEKRAMEAIVDAGQSAPNAGPFQITVIEKSGLLRRLSERAKAGMLNSGVEFLIERASLPGYDPIYGAPALFLLSAPKDGPYGAANTSLAAENMILAATELGLGTCYLITPTLAFRGEGRAELAAESGIPEGYEVLCAVAAGSPAGDAFVVPKKAKGQVNYVR
ncbi:MAG: nitroreductase family protein [Clostridia bacterium]|nr:nitroreductase family protein [Clostridia bacterium]